MSDQPTEPTHSLLKCPKCGKRGVRSEQWDTYSNFWCVSCGWKKRSDDAVCGGQVSPQPTEKHEFVAGTVHPQLCIVPVVGNDICWMPRKAAVHGQPSAVQVPEQATPQKLYTIPRQVEAALWTGDDTSYLKSWGCIIAAAPDEAGTIWINELGEEDMVCQGWWIVKDPDDPDGALFWVEPPEKFERWFAPDEAQAVRIAGLEDALATERASAISVIEVKRDALQAKVNGSGGTYRQYNEWNDQIQFAEDLIAALKPKSETVKPKEGK